MMRRPTGALVLGLFLGTLLAIHLARRRDVAVPEEAPAEDGQISVALAARIFPEAAVTRVGPETEWTGVYDVDGNPLGAVVSTSPEMDHILGYAGPVPVLIGADPAGMLVNAVLLEHNETPGFVRRIQQTGFLDQWRGRTLDEISDLAVDAVTGATLTSDAITESIRGRLAPMAGQPITVAAHPRPGFVILSFQGLDAAILALLCIALLVSARPAFLSRPRVFKVARTLVLSASLGLLGFYGATMFSMGLWEGWAAGGRLHGGAGTAVLVLAAVLIPLLAGRNLYCRHLCPFGAAQELLHRLAPRKRRLPPALFRRLRRLRYGMLVAVAVSMIAGRGLRPDLQEPFSAFRWQAAGWPALGMALGALLVTLAGIHRPWCSFFCSSGALLDSLRIHRRAGKDS